MYIEVYQNAHQTTNTIEVVGMPAVGKSTYCKKLVSENSHYVDSNALLPSNHLMRQLFKLGTVCICLIRHPKKFFKSFNLMLKSRQKSVIDFLKVCSNWFLMCHMFEAAGKKKDRVYVFDQGVFQAIWSILFSAKEQVDIMELLKCIKCPSTVVFLDEQDDVIREREARREKNIRLDYNNIDQINKARDAIKRIRIILENWYEQKQIVDE